MNRAEADLEVSQARVKKLEADVRLLRAELAILREDYQRLTDALAKRRRRAKAEIKASPSYAKEWRGILRELSELATESLPEKPHDERLREKLRTP
jgi:hypothetical protein